MFRCDLWIYVFYREQYVWWWNTTSLLPSSVFVPCGAFKIRWSILNILQHSRNFVACDDDLEKHFGSKAGLVLPAGEADEAAALAIFKQLNLWGQFGQFGFSIEFWFLCAWLAGWPWPVRGFFYLTSVTTWANEALCTLPVPHYDVFKHYILVTLNRNSACIVFCKLYKNLSSKKWITMLCKLGRCKS